VVQSVARFLLQLQRRLGPNLSALELQQRRGGLAVALGLGCWLLRPLPPFMWLPGAVVGAFLLWAALELSGLLWRPQRWH